jgi:hypothetical protein
MIPNVWSHTHNLFSNVNIRYPFATRTVSAPTWLNYNLIRLPYGSGRTPETGINVTCPEHIFVLTPFYHNTLFIFYSDLAGDNESQIALTQTQPVKRRGVTEDHRSTRASETIWIDAAFTLDGAPSNLDI